MVYKIGVYSGKFYPPHRGHLYAIMHASTRCEKLYVIVSHHPDLSKELSEKNNIPVMDLKLRAKWLSQELQGFDHIEVLMLDETGIPVYPYGWAQWSQMVRDLVPGKIDVIFGGEPEYKAYNDQYFPEAVYEVFDHNRERYPISATKIRSNPLQHWDFILGSAHPFFAKKVLIAGTESCAKTTLTKYLAKAYHTSWSEEEGRYYSGKFLGGNEGVFTVEDFGRIAIQQYEADMHALRTCNKVVFYDSDAVVTQYYCQLYLNSTSVRVGSFIDSSRYDVVLFMTPDVPWVADGMRWNRDDWKRWQLHQRLKDMYISRGFGDKIIEIGGNYTERLDKAMAIVDGLLK